MIIPKVINYVDTLPKNVRKNMAGIETYFIFGSLTASLSGASPRYPNTAPKVNELSKINNLPIVNNGIVCLGEDDFSLDLSESKFLEIREFNKTDRLWNDSDANQLCYTNDIFYIKNKTEYSIDLYFFSVPFYVYSDNSIYYDGLYFPYEHGIYSSLMLQGPVTVPSNGITIYKGANNKGFNVRKNGLIKNGTDAQFSSNYGGFLIFVVCEEITNIMALQADLSGDHMVVDTVIDSIYTKTPEPAALTGFSEVYAGKMKKISIAVDENVKKIDKLVIRKLKSTSNSAVESSIFKDGIHVSDITDVGDEKLMNARVNSTRGRSYYPNPTIDDVLTNVIYITSERELVIYDFDFNSSDANNCTYLYKLRFIDANGKLIKEELSERFDSPLKTDSGANHSLDSGNAKGVIKIENTDTWGNTDVFSGVLYLSDMVNTLRPSNAENGLIESISVTVKEFHNGSNTPYNTLNYSKKIIDEWFYEEDLGSYTPFIVYDDIDILEPRVYVYLNDEKILNNTGLRRLSNNNIEVELGYDGNNDSRIFIIAKGEDYFNGNDYAEVVINSVWTTSSTNPNQKVTSTKSITIRAI